jgi:saccharopine dehydrogenase-like NADP-dependent oxidoreductase
MSKFLKGIKGNEKKEVTSYDADAIAEKLHSVSASATIAAVEIPAPVAVATEIAPKAVEKRKSTRIIIAEEDKEELHRLTLDIPKDIMDQMRKDTKRRGQTIKGFIVSLIYDFYEKPQ